MSISNKGIIEMLNQDQQRVYDTITSSPDISKHMIVGNAGTGKTYLTSKIVQYFVQKNDSMGVAVIAPTHQAVKVAKQAIGIPDCIVHYCTVSSMLGQFGFRGDEGDSIFCKPRLSKKSSQFSTIIVDEVSQLSKAQEEILNSLQVRVVFVGDDAQLKAVMSKSTDLFHSCENIYRLSIQMRNEGSIESVANKCRIKFYFPNKSNDNIRVHNDDRELLGNFLSTLSKAEDKFSVVYLAYRNEKVEKVSSLICKKQFPYLRLECNDTSLGKRGDVVVIVKWLKENQVCHHTGVVYHTVLAVPQEDPEATPVNLNIIDHHQIVMVEEKIKQLFKARKSHKKKDNQYSSLSDELDNLSSMYTPVSSPFVMTVHKAQGISRDKVFVDTLDINNSNSKTRLLYVAYSRAKKELHTIKV